VINYYAHKDPRVVEEEKYRYTRFLGIKVNYTTMSFENFASAPLAVIRP
jgi:hypothetical protein